MAAMAKKLKRAGRRADQAPLGSGFVEASEEELAEASGLLDMAEDRFDDLFRSR